MWTVLSWFFLASYPVGLGLIIWTVAKSDKEEGEDLWVYVIVFALSPLVVVYLLFSGVGDLLRYKVGRRKSKTT
jgi:hypothetical protein